MAVVTFDCYGTLVDWMYSVGSFLVRYLGSDLTEEFLKCDIEEVRRPRPYSQILKVCLRKLADGTGVKYEDRLGEAFVISFAKSPPFPDVPYGLMMLREAGHKIGVISNTERRLIEVTLKGLEDLIDFVVTAEDTGFYKPDLRAFTKALELMGVSKGDVIHVSAYPSYDLIPAEKLGVRTVLLKRYGFSWHTEVGSVEDLLRLPGLRT